MSDRLTIAHWSEDDQPRERLRDQGPQALSNAELLAILIGSGTTGTSAVDLMQQILADCNNNLNTLGKMTIRELCQYKGIGEAKAITILAACELGKRRQMESPEERPDLGTATRIYNHIHPMMFFIISPLSLIEKDFVLVSSKLLGDCIIFIPPPNGLKPVHILPSFISGKISL